MRPDRKRNWLFGFDYSTDAFYFVTSCVKEIACVFGEVVNEEMHLNAYGQIAELQWQCLLAKYPYVQSHAFVVMPNHIHVLMVIYKDMNMGSGEHQKNVKDLECDDQECVGTGQALSVHDQGEPKVRSVSQVIGEYKTMTSKLIRLAGLLDFTWQRSFHDHIVRNARSFQYIQNYIENNPANWKEDTFRR